MALFIATIFAARNVSTGAERRPPAVGVDFIAFYTAGDFVRTGQGREIYDMRAVQRYQQALARRLGADLGNGCGPWWNPPFYALVFVPLSFLPYLTAIQVWILVNVLCAAAACVLLVRLLPEGTPWKTWALVPVLLALATPFFNTLSHAQNTGTSLLLLCVTVTLWQRGRSPSFTVRSPAFLAGATGGLLFYKPQLAAVLAVVLVLDLGWPAAAGLATAGLSLLLITLFALPGTLGDYLHRLPLNVHQVQTRTLYLWDRHVTFKAFWRLLIQGPGVGETSAAVQSLALSSMALVGVGLLYALWRGRHARRGSGPESAVARRRLIAAAIAATPLLVPFYFDYDLLLLAVPAVLFAGERIARTDKGTSSKLDRWLPAAWTALYLWLMLNPAVAERTRVNLATPLLTVVASLLIARAGRREGAVERADVPIPAALSRAA